MKKVERKVYTIYQKENEGEKNKLIFILKTIFLKLIGSLLLLE